MKILSIETSCDETAVAVLEAEGSFGDSDFGIKVLANNLLSQAKLHAEFGGVYPNLAKREHGRNLVPILKKTLEEAGFANPKLQITNSVQHPNKLELVGMLLERNPELREQFLEHVPGMEIPDIDIIAVTEGPGLEPALWVGISFAKALGALWNKPVMGVNHMEGHFYSVLLEEEKTRPMKFPALALLVSGNHTEIVLAKDWGHYEILGQTRDDAVGEAFDKAARLLGLPYPGGPEISRLATEAKKLNIKSDTKLPRPMIGSKDYDFSYSGLKTALLYEVKRLKKENPELSEDLKMKLAREFEEAAIEVLIHKTEKAVLQYNPRTLISAGGVTANAYLRSELAKLAQKFSELDLRIPDKGLSTDNAIMIGIAAYANVLKKGLSDQGEIIAQGNLRLGN